VTARRSPDAAGKLMLQRPRGDVPEHSASTRAGALENIGRNDPGYLQWLMTKAELPGSTLAVMRNALADMHA
jgi:hypothetical protein